VSRLGLLGGTFDPVHLGHLDVARAARRALLLDRVLLVPAWTPPHRTLPQASAPHRFAMTALAIQNEDGLAVSDLDMQTPDAAFTSRTIARLASKGVDLRTVFFVTGADAFREIATWHDYPALLDRCHFVVVSRPDCPVTSLTAILPGLADRMHRMPGHVPSNPAILLVDAPTAAVSSTEVRRRLAAGHPVGDLIPEAVASHIARHGLYRHDATPDEGPE
jgi:nicotinate-nucleotide adenylyltransferase